MRDFLVVAGVSYTVKAESAEQAEDLLFDFLDEHQPAGDHGGDVINILKLWVSGHQDNEGRGFALKVKEAAAMEGLDLEVVEWEEDDE